MRWSALVWLLLLVGCQARTDHTLLGSTTPRWGGTLRVPNQDDFRTLDPAIGYDEVTSFGIHSLFNTLVNYDASLNIVPELAERFELSPDGLVYTFWLHHGVLFHNGREMTAVDVSYALHRILDPQVPCPGAAYYRKIKGAGPFTEGKTDHIEGIQVLDPYTLQITLEGVDMTFLKALALPFAAPIPKEEVERWGDQFGRHPVGTGPFVLKEWRSDEIVIFERNNHYWEEGLPYLDRIEFLPGYSREVAFLKFESGEVDQLDRLTSPDYLWVISNPELKKLLLTGPAMDFMGEQMNTEMPPFDNKKFRQALNYAVNKQVQIKLRNNRYEEARGPLPPQLPGFDDTLVGYPYNLEKAKKLMAEAGYPNGYPGRITYWTPVSEASIQLSQALQQDLKAVGVDMEIKLVDFPTYLTASGRRGTVAFSYGAWLMDFPDPSNFLIPLFHSMNATDENATNGSFYVNPHVDELLELGQKEVDPVRRLEYYREVQRIVVDDAPYIFEYHQLKTEMVQPWVKGYRLETVWPRNFRTTWLDLPGTRDTPPARSP